MSDGGRADSGPMARSISASAAAVLCLLATGAVPAQATSRSTHRKARCAAARSSGGARSGTRSFRKAHCPKGGGHKPAGHHKGRPAHLLFFTAKDGRCPDARLPPAPQMSPRSAPRRCAWSTANAPPTARRRCTGTCTSSAGRPGAHREHGLRQLLRTHRPPRGNAARPHARGPATSTARGSASKSARTSAGAVSGSARPRAVVAAWMASPGHRANILDASLPRHRHRRLPHAGGLAHGQSGGIYTQDFGVIVGG